MLNADWTGWKALWIHRMTDPRYHRLVPDTAARYLQIDTLERIIAGRERLSDPLHPESIKIRLFMEACAAGGEFVTEDIKTGEIVRRWTLPETREGSAPHN